LDSWIDAIISVMLVANVAPILPTVLGVVEPVPRSKRRRILLLALLVGNVSALAFLLAGGPFLAAVGSGIDDLRVAGGLILLVFAMYDLLFSREQRKEPLGEIIEAESPASGSEVGLVPLGIPMMVGPATLTAILVVSEVYGTGVAIIALLANGLVNAGILFLGGPLMDRIGHGVIRTVGKVFGLLLAALAISMIRTGVTNMWLAVSRGMDS
jgi:multiple antibiotic resistance protein